MNYKFKWQEDIKSEEWDNLLAMAKGHPLQSAKWGNSRKIAEGIKNYCWAAFKNEQLIYLVRFEERRFFKFIKIAWIPKGPTILAPEIETEIQEEFFQRLRQKKFFACAASQWRKIRPSEMKSLPNYTIWIDLSVGKEVLWKNLDKQFRYDARRAIKEGVVVEQATTPNDVKDFYELCKSISYNKGFHLNASIERLQYLLTNEVNTGVSAHLFVSRYQDKLCAGAFIIRCGQSVHYIWGAVDRAYSKQRVGEAVQWGVIEWALSQNCILYDLEGINPQNHDGVYNFKKKLGGEVITLPSEKIFPLNNYAHVAELVLRATKILKQFFKNIFRIRVVKNI